MTLYEFNILDINHKMEAINQHGIFLDNYITNKEKCNLYALDMFFAEVVYNPVSNSITEIRSFKTGELLKNYSIDLSKGF